MRADANANGALMSVLTDGAALSPRLELRIQDDDAPRNPFVFTIRLFTITLRRILGQIGEELFRRCRDHRGLDIQINALQR